MEDELFDEDLEEVLEDTLSEENEEDSLEEIIEKEDSSNDFLVDQWKKVSLENDPSKLESKEENIDDDFRIKLPNKD